MELLLSPKPFNLDLTLSCGQVFRWDKVGSWWYGVVEENVLKVKQTRDRLIFDSYPETVTTDFIERYFRLDDDLSHIILQITKDDLIADAVRCLPGLRITRQDIWECLISYICATNANIPFIKSMIQTISRKHGQRIVFENQEFYTLPRPEVLAKIDEFSLGNLGYRARYVIETSKRVANEFDLNVLRKLTYRDGKKLLLSKKRGRKLLLGVGPKVADCVLLFSLEKTEAFPVDIWILKTVLDFYSNQFERQFIERLREKISAGYPITKKEYETVCGTMQSYFGKYAGYAQEYLFYFRRSAPLHGVIDELDANHAQISH